MFFVKKWLALNSKMFCCRHINVHLMYHGVERCSLTDMNFNALYGMDYYCSSVLHKKVLGWYSLEYCLGQALMSTQKPCFYRECNLLTIATPGEGTLTRFTVCRLVKAFYHENMPI